MTPLRGKMIKEMQLRRFSEKTQKTYIWAVADLARYYSTSPDKISGSQFRDYCLYLTNRRNLSWSSVNTITAAIRFFYSEVVGRKDMAIEIPSRRTPRRLPEILSPRELIRLFDSVKNLKHKMILMTTYGCGLRIGEVINLKVVDIDSSRMMVRVSHGKGDKDRYTILSTRLLTELRSYWRTYRPKEWLFPNEVTREKLNTATPRRIFMAAKERAGIKKKVTFHSLRHNFGTNLLEAGADIKTIQILMGHSSIATTAKYLHVARKDLKGIKNPLDLLYVPDTKNLAGA